MSHSIAYFVHGRGMGHASRALQTLPRLRAAGLDVRLFAAGDALPLLRPHESATEVATCRPGANMLRAFAARVRSDRARLQALDVSLVVSDGDGPSIHAAASLGLSSLAVGHGLIFGHCQLPIRLPLRHRWRERVNAASSSWLSRSRIAVHFAPLSPRTPGTYVARPDLPDWSDTQPGTGDYVLAYFRDGNGDRELTQLVRRGHRVVCFGEPRRAVASVDYRPAAAREFARWLPGALGVIGSAGNHLPAECAMLGVPLLALYAAGDVEHSMNAALIESAGLGLSCRFGRLDRRRLAAFEARLGVLDSALAERTRQLPGASEVITRRVLAAAKAASTAATPGSLARSARC